MRPLGGGHHHLRSSSTAQGSGIILSENGYIITNAHVVSGGEKFEVVLQNGDSYDATVIGADNQSDLALLKMQNPPEGLVAATFGNSDELEVGEMVVAIGNPGGLALASTQTVGYISAVQRTITTELGYTMVCIQADAAINPGNSGGPSSIPTARWWASPPASWWRKATRASASPSPSIPPCPFWTI